MRTESKVAELFVHKCDKVYYSRGRAETMSLDGDRTPAEVVQQPWVQDAESIKILGTRTNAAIIAELHNQRLKSEQGLPTIHVGSPSLCHMDRDPADVLRQAQQMEDAPSVGGWKTLSTSDYRSYALTAAVVASDGVITPHIRRLFKAHPAYSALKFLPALREPRNEPSAITLLSHMVDPRFNIDPSKPNDYKRLNNFFGMGRPGGVENVTAYLAGKVPVANNTRYPWARMVLDTWSHNWMDLHAMDDISPENFLMRVVRRVLANKDVPVSLIRASYVFLRYLQLTWLDAGTPERAVYRQIRRTLGGRPPEVVKTRLPCKRYSPTLFIPEYFFAQKDEALAWRMHTYAQK